MLNNTDLAMHFLKTAFPSQPRCLTAIPPEGGRTTTRTFFKDDDEQCSNFIEAHNGKNNLYYQVNPVNRSINSKAKRSDIHYATRLHVDVDPRDGFDLADEQKRILDDLMSNAAKLPEPSMIIFSGGGYQALWDLVEEDWVTINSQESTNEIERRNIYLARHYGGDSCHDISRLLRLPGSYNIPNKKKREKGRKVCMAKVIHSNNKKYGLADFPRAKTEKIIAATRSIVKQIDTASPITNDYLQKMPLSSRTKNIIVLGYDPNSPHRYPSRSEAQWCASCEMVRAGISDPIHKAILLDHRLGISECVLDKPNPEQYANRQIQGAHDAKRK